VPSSSRSGLLEVLVTFRGWLVEYATTATSNVMAGYMALFGTVRRLLRFLFEMQWPPAAQVKIVRSVAGR
jgi:hypothetical protein